MATKLRDLSGPITHGAPLRVSVSHKVRADRLRRRMGAAWSRIAASCEAQAQAIGKHHTTVVHRRQGQGPHAETGVEVDALERMRIDTEPLLMELLVIRAQALAATLTDDELLREIADYQRREHQLEGQENAASHRAALTGCPLTLAAGMAPETEAQLRIQALASLAAERGLSLRAIG